MVGHESMTDQDFAASKAVVPCLPISVHSAFAIDLNVLSTPDHEGNTLLKGIVKVIVLPVLDIVGELCQSCQTHK